MKHLKSTEIEKQLSVNESPGTMPDDLKQSKIDFTPTSDDVAKRAYFNYVNQGFRPGHDIQHWLDAETELIAERYLGRVHEFRNRT
jgi:Protein of unknown function (DUF2934)